MKTRWNHLEYNCLNIPYNSKWPLINDIRSDIEASEPLQLAIYQRWCRSWIKYDTLGQVISHILRRKNSRLIEELILYGVSIIRRVSQWHVLPLVMRHYHVKSSCSTFSGTWPGVGESVLNLLWRPNVRLDVNKVSSSSSTERFFGLGDGEEPFKGSRFKVSHFREVSNWKFFRDCGDVLAQCSRHWVTDAMPWLTQAW